MPIVSAWLLFAALQLNCHTFIAPVLDCLFVFVFLLELWQPTEGRNHKGRTGSVFTDDLFQWVLKWLKIHCTVIPVKTVQLFTQMFIGWNYLNYLFQLKSFFFTNERFTVQKHHGASGGSNWWSVAVLGYQPPPPAPAEDKTEKDFMQSVLRHGGRGPVAGWRTKLSPLLPSDCQGKLLGVGDFLTSQRWCRVKCLSLLARRPGHIFQMYQMYSFLLMQLDLTVRYTNIGQWW